MFSPKTGRIKALSEKFPRRIEELERIFNGTTNVYIDYANIRPWSSKLGWHIDLKRLKQFLDSFDTIKVIKLYNGILIGNEESERLAREIDGLGYNFKTKPVKRMRISIDVSSIPPDSPDILKDFIRKPLLQKLKLETLAFLNNQLRELNNQGIFFIEDLKCNFDVEIGRDMLLDYNTNNVDAFALWSGDSDFADPVNQLLKDQKKVFLFATSRRVSSELSSLRDKGLFIFDIQKIKEFICWRKEISTL